MNDAPFYQDFLGQKVYVGDEVIFAYRAGSSAWLRRGVITSISTSHYGTYERQTAKIKTGDAAPRVFTHQRSVKVPHGL